MIERLSERARIAWMRLFGRAQPEGVHRRIAAEAATRALGGMGLLPGQQLTRVILEELEKLALLVRAEDVWLVNDGHGAEDACLFADLLAESPGPEAPSEAPSKPLPHT